MLFFVAIATGAGWDIDKIAREMPLGVLREWAAFRKMHPLSMSPQHAQHRQDWNAAMITASLWNITAATHIKRPPQRSINDFIYQDKSKRVVQKGAKELFGMFKTAVGADKVIPTV